MEKMSSIQLKLDELKSRIPNDQYGKLCEVTKRISQVQQLHGRVADEGAALIELLISAQVPCV